MKLHIMGKKIIQKFSFKNVLSLTIEYRMYLKFLQKPRCLGWLNKVEFLERQFHSKMLLFVQKKKLSILLNFLFPFVSFIGVFSILKCKTLVLKTTTWWTCVSHFVDGWHLLRCQIRFFPQLLSGWPFDFCGGGGMGDLVRVSIFFPNL